MKNAYSLKWNNDTIPVTYFQFNSETDNYDLYLFSCKIKAQPSLFYRLVTIKKYEVIDGQTCFNMAMDKDWKEQSFYITGNKEIIVYKNTVENGERVEKKQTASFKIQKDGQFIQLNTPEK